MSPVTALEALRAQTHALRTTAGFLDRLGMAGLSVVLIDDRITVRIPHGFGNAAARAAALARLAAALGVHPIHDAYDTGTWLTANATLDGHPVRAFTSLDDT